MPHGCLRGTKDEALTRRMSREEEVDGGGGGGTGVVLGEGVMANLPSGR